MMSQDDRYTWSDSSRSRFPLSLLTDFGAFEIFTTGRSNKIMYQSVSQCI